MSRYGLSLLFGIACLLHAGRAAGDDLLVASGMKLRPAQRRFVEKRMDELRDGDPACRFEAVTYLVNLDRTALPFLLEAVKQSSNPMVVRCANLALAEIGGPEATEALAAVAGSKRYDRDERVTAALGLGKVAPRGKVALLRALLDPRENRWVRKAAAVALARLRDEAAVKPLLRGGRTDREVELSSLFLLCACMIGPEDLVAEMPRLLSTLKHRRSVLVLGAAFLDDPALLPELLKYADRDRKVHAFLAVTLGRYRSPAAAAFLANRVQAGGPAAVDALYSLGNQEGEAATAAFRVGLRSRDPLLRAHALLALVDCGRAEGFLDALRQGLKDPDPSVRGAAALALERVGGTDLPERIAAALGREKDPAAAAELLLVLGLRGGPQQVASIRPWLRGKGDPSLAALAEAAFKCCTGKLDRRILEERYAARISERSAAWRYRLRDRVMEVLFAGLELDRIMRRVKDKGSGGSGGTSSGGGEGDGDTGSGGAGSGEGSGGSDAGGGGNTTTGTGGDTGPKKKFDFRYDVLEWDLLNWFQAFGYFPDAYFEGRR